MRNGEQPMRWKLFQMFKAAGKKGMEEWWTWGVATGSIEQSILISIYIYVFELFLKLTPATSHFKVMANPPRSAPCLTSSMWPQDIFRPFQEFIPSEQPPNITWAASSKKCSSTMGRRGRMSIHEWSKKPLWKCGRVRKCWHVGLSMVYCWVLFLGKPFICS